MFEESLKIIKEKGIKFEFSHDRNTGHVYIIPLSNLYPFSDDEETAITETLKENGIGFIKNRVLRNFTTKPIQKNYGFRLFSLPCKFEE